MTKETVVKKRILTGDRPTGSLHLGHFVGSLEQRVKYQNDYETFILLADVQALTDNFLHPEKLKENVLEVLLDNLAVGVDPAKVTFYLQSQVPQTAELFVYFLNLVSVERVGRNPTVKEEISQKKGVKEEFKGSTPLGFYVYPVHQAADILSVNANFVPVGEDQLPMIEITREIAQKFNKTYESVFHLPEPKVSPYPRLCGIDGGTKMGKSLGNAIYLKDDAKTVEEKVMRMYTDPKRVHPTDQGTVEGNPVFIYHRAFNKNMEEVKDLEERYLKGTVGDIEVKKKLVTALNLFLDPIREKRHFYNEKKDLLLEVLHEGTKKTKIEAEKVLENVRQVMRLGY